MVVKIIGVKRSEYKGKDGSNRIGFNYMGAKDFTQYERENTQIEGQDVVREFSNTDFNIHPGDVVEFVYEPGYENRATLVDVKPIKLSDNPFDGDDKDKQSKK